MTPIVEAICRELDVQEMVLADPLTLRRLQAERIARAVQAATPSPDLKAGNAALVEALESVQPMIDHAIDVEGLSEPCEAEVLCGSSVCEYAGCIIDKAVAIRAVLQRFTPASTSDTP